MRVPAGTASGGAAEPAGEGSAQRLEVNPDAGVGLGSNREAEAHEDEAGEQRPDGGEARGGADAVLEGRREERCNG